MIICLQNVSLVAVGLSILAQCILGGLWYSSCMFGNLWVKEMTGCDSVAEFKEKLSTGYSESNDACCNSTVKDSSCGSMKKACADYKMGIFHMIGCVVMAAMLALGVSYFIKTLEITTIWEALMLVKGVWLAFFLPVQLSEMLFQKKSLCMALIDGTYWLIGMGIMSYLVLTF